MIKTPVLLNAAEMERLYPDTFHRPAPDLLRQLQIFDFAKVCTPCEGRLWGRKTFGERFWLEIISVDYPFFVGRIDNKLETVCELKYDDLIRFHADNIYAVQDMCESLPGQISV